MDTTLSPSREPVARLLDGFHGDCAAALGLSSRARVGVRDLQAEFENKRRVAAETWDRCGEPSLPVIDRAAASRLALRASAKNSRLPNFRSPLSTLHSPLSTLRFLPSAPLARAAALALALLASPALLVNQASAATYTWDGGGVNASWATAANWNGDVAPTFGTTADIIIAGTIRNQTFINVDRIIRSLTFDATNDAFTQIALSSAFTNTATSRHLTFSADSGNATLTVAADSTGNKQILRTANATTAASNLTSNMTLTSSLDIIHDGSGTLTIVGP